MNPTTTPETPSTGDWVAFAFRLLLAGTLLTVGIAASTDTLIAGTILATIGATLWVVFLYGHVARYGPTMPVSKAIRLPAEGATPPPAPSHTSPSDPGTGTTESDGTTASRDESPPEPRTDGGTAIHRAFDGVPHDADVTATPGTVRAGAAGWRFRCPHGHANLIPRTSVGVYHCDTCADHDDAESDVYAPGELVDMEKVSAARKEAGK